MSKMYKLAVRVAEMREIATFEIPEGEDLDARVRIEIAKAHEAGLLGELATRIKPAASVTEIGEGENLAGGENILSTSLYSFDGTPLSDRGIRVDPVDKNFVAIGVEESGSEEGGTERTLGVLPSEELAFGLANLWRSGYVRP